MKAPSRAATRPARSARESSGGAYVASSTCGVEDVIAGALAPASRAAATGSAAGASSAVPTPFAVGSTQLGSTLSASALDRRHCEWPPLLQRAAQRVTLEDKDCEEHTGGVPEGTGGGSCAARASW